jgi:HD superfamily phosphohydrolase
LSDTISKYIQDWLPKDAELIQFYLGIDEFLAEYLYSPNQKDFEQIQAKIIADPLLGYIHLRPLEVAIIDTKLFQRLRKIKQLGLANVVFPSLGYSRFEHSLGVLGRLNQVLNKLVENNLRNDDKSTLSRIIDEYLVSIRLSALLHDVGHCIFSHCSERIIERTQGENNYPDAARIQQLISEHFKKEKKIPFAEIFSVVILGSKRFQTFVEELSLFNTKEAKKILEQCGRFILGLPIENKPETLFLSQLLSSGLDVDKIDYMVREQHYSGIKLEIDLDRILSKLRVFDLKSFELPKNIEHHKKFFKADSSFKVLGFEKGGQFAFEEFCVARLALHVKIYLHQKVRAAEGQLSGYLFKLTQKQTFKEIHNWLRLSESIIELPESIGTFFPSAGTLFQFNLAASEINSFKKIDNRDILYRAFSFGPMNSYSEGYGAEDIDLRSKRIEAFFESFNIPDLREKIVEEAIRISDEYEIKFNYDLLNEMFIEIPRLINIQQGQESLYFERASWLPLKWTIPIDKILIYFQENRALAYIFSPKEIAHVVTVASEKILFELCNKVFSQEGNISKNTFAAYNTLKNTLANKGFYSRLPQLRPVSDYLKGAEASERIQYIQEKLAGFKSLNNEYITINRITTFVNQFPEHLQDVCLSFLKHLQIYNESLLKDETEKVLIKVTNGDKKIGVTYLGAVSDSGGRLAYHLRPILDKFGIEPEEFNDDFVVENDKIVFYDDNINSGLQVINIFAELLDEKLSLPPEFVLKEKHHRRLKTEDAKFKLKNMPIYLTYIIGFDYSITTVLDILVSYLGFKAENINFNIHRLMTDKEKIFSGADSKFDHVHKRDLRTFLSQIGEKLLQSDNKDGKRVENGKLGYANAEAMVLFPYNIPTMTITALWHSGKIDGTPWIPIAERRRRSSKDGNFIGED